MLAALHSPSPSLKLSVGFAQAALTPQQDPRRSRGEESPKANQQQTASPTPLHSPSPSLELSVGFAQAALTPQRDPRRGESKGKQAANSKQQVRRYPRGVELRGFAQVALAPQRDPRSRGESSLYYD
ncbi:hypothetical protein NDU88_007957 [Pleurodeles waltl]|uniref:Uncharacterized protein n=1 Tax=Pleurodeles waltl TaxID=8319 RepID=A0AAV7N3M4_PLEWA|nr:hypothetical protein NDU88_007957 [Pleurodeles waltl]